MNHLTTLILAGAALAGAFTQEARAQCSSDELHASDGSRDDRFGTSVSVFGATALVGAPFDDVAGTDSGSVYVFESTALGWSPADKLTPNDGAAGERFGWSVDLFADTAVIGAPQDDDSGAGSGSVYVFQRTVLGWSQVDKLTAAGGAAGDAFGYSLSVSGDTVVIGAPGAVVVAGDSGAGYVFERLGTTWSQTAVLFASAGAGGHFLGTSTSLAGGTAVLGGTGFDIPGGRAYVFERSAAGVWGPNETARLSPSPGSPTLRFGFSVATAGDVALVGDPLDNPGSFGSGAIYVFERTGPGAWSANETAKLTVNAGQEILEFGFSVDLSGNLAVVGAFETHGGNGAGYAFRRDASGWAQVATLRPDDLSAAGGYGSAAAVAGSTALFGATSGDGLASDSGTAHVFEVPRFGAGYCFCNDSAPCFNEYGSAGCANSIGRGALLAACGSSSVAVDDLVLTVRDVPANQFGLVFMGAGQSLAPFGDGQLCVAAGGVGLFRFPVGDSGGAGVLVQGPGIAAFSQASFPPPAHITAGQTWSFQGWYRDPVGSCGSGFNLSNAFSVTFRP